MSILEASSSPWTARVLSILRIVAGLIFLTTGSGSLFGFPASDPPRPAPDPWTELWIGSVLQLVGGLALTLGLLTRPVAFVLAGEMAVAYFQFHFPKSFFPSVNGGTAAALSSLLFLYFSLAGAGPWSLDAKVARAEPRLVTGAADPARV